MTYKSTKDCHIFCELPKVLALRPGRRVARLRYVDFFQKNAPLPVVGTSLCRGCELDIFHVRLAALLSPEWLSLPAQGNGGKPCTSAFAIQAYSLFQWASPPAPRRRLKTSATSSPRYGASCCRAESWWLFGKMEVASCPCDIVRELSLPI